MVIWEGKNSEGMRMINRYGVTIWQVLLVFFEKKPRCFKLLTPIRFHFSHEVRFSFRRRFRKNDDDDDDGSTKTTPTDGAGIAPNTRDLNLLHRKRRMSQVWLCNSRWNRPLTFVFSHSKFRQQRSCWRGVGGVGFPGKHNVFVPNSFATGHFLVGS